MPNRQTSFEECHALGTKYSRLGILQIHVLLGILEGFLELTGLGVCILRAAMMVLKPFTSGRCA